MCQAKSPFACLSWPVLPAALSIDLLATSAVAADLPPGFARLADVAPSIRQEMRYAGAHNFTGRAVPGYEAGSCWLRREVARALAGVERDLERRHWRLVVYDCYRPKRAVAAFLAWSRDAADQLARREFYPGIDKQDLFRLGYIARSSSHSKGIAVDAGAERLDGQGVATPIDFGSGFDLFDPRSWTASSEITPEEAANRRVLVAAFAAQGLVNYTREWWHYSLPALQKAPAYDVVIGR